MATITTRRATVDDAVAISALTLALSARHIVPDCSPEGAAKLLASMDVAATEARLRAAYRAWIATDGDALVAVLVLRPPRHLYHLFVADTWQRQGLALQLWDTACAVLLAEGAEPITVKASRHAVAVYERLGFIRDGEEHGADGVPSIPMRWWLEPRPE